MRDRRSVDNLTVEELERVLRIKKREARMQRLDRLASAGRRRADVPLPEELEIDPAPVSQGRHIPHSSFAGAEGKRWRDRSLRDKLLLGIEVAAALGLVGILIFSAITIRTINEEAATEQAARLADLPTAVPTPLISAVVLPGGHTPPTGPEGGQPNYDEVPAYLRPQVEQQFLGPASMPTPGPTLANRIRIPTLGIDAPVVQGDGWEQLKQGVAQHIGTGNPGQPGNIVLSAHNDIYGEIFRHLDQLREGDEIILQSLNGTYSYEVLYSRIVQPGEVSVMVTASEPIVTLISCYPYLVDNKRIIVVAKLTDS